MGLLNKIGLLFEDKTFSVKDEGWYVSFVTNKKGQVLDVSSFELRTKPKNHTIFFLGGEKAKDLGPEWIFFRFLLLCNTRS